MGGVVPRRVPAPPPRAPAPVPAPQHDAGAQRAPERALGNRTTAQLAGPVRSGPFPYPATPASDEVALRSSPAGRRADAAFHNLVASLRSDAVLVVEGHVGGWMKVHVRSGTALDGRTNAERDAAGLTGYVSAELLVRTPVPPPPPPAPVNRDSWTRKALAAAGIDARGWRANAGFRANRTIFEKVYAYYASLYDADPRLKWAAMAKLAGGEVFRGFRDQLLPSEDFGAMLSKADPDDHPLINLAGNAYSIYAGSLDIRLMQMQQAIFFDLAWQHQAYREGGIGALREAHARGELPTELLDAWSKIDSSDPARVDEGNRALLRREQETVLQPFYKLIQDIPDNDQIPESMSEEARSPIPGGLPFQKVVPDGDITTFPDRWKWLEKDMIPAFERLPPDQLRTLVRKRLDELADRKF